MLTALLILPMLWAAAGAGSALLNWVGAAPPNALVLEKRLFGLAVGLVLAAYLSLIFGLVGQFNRYLAALCFLPMILMGASQYPELAREMLDGLRDIKWSPQVIAASLIFLLFGLTSLIGCFAPPISTEYDSLSYHLADPKIYLAHHRIMYLPWESHSNFAFTMEMLYSIGLSLGSVPLAKLFHFTMGILAVAGTILVGRRIHSTNVGLAAGVLFASLPLVYWEAGTAYVDLGATAFGTLGLVAVLAGLSDSEHRTSWLRCAAFIMAGMVSVKATSLIPVALFAILVLAVGIIQERRSAASAVRAFAFASTSIVLGSVWYVKSWILTGNPFFPFGYSIFGGKHWSASNAAAYAHSQAQFGTGHRLVDLVLAPWNLLMYLNPAVSGVSYHPFNDFATYIVSLSPMLLASLFVPVFWRRRTDPALAGLAIYGLLSLVIWFFLTQQIRYLLPVLPVYCILTAYVFVEILQTRLLVRYVLSGLFVASLIFSLIIAWCSLVQPELPMVDGAESQAAYIQAGFPPYAAMEYLNTETPKSDGVAFYGEPTDFYCDRPYMWAEPGHGLVIPYNRMTQPVQLEQWFVSHGIHYIFIDYSEAPIGPGAGMNGLVYGLTYGSGSHAVYQMGPISIYEIPRKGL